MSQLEMTTGRTFSQRLRQGAITCLTCLAALVGTMAALVGADGLASALPLLVIITAVAAAVGVWVRPRPVLKQVLLGFVVAGGGLVAMLAHVVFSLSYR